MHTHTYSHAHILTRAYTQRDTQHIHTYRHTCAHTVTCICIHVYTHVHVHSHSHSHTCMCMHTERHARACRHTCAQYLNVHTCTCTQSPINTCTQHEHTRMLTCTHRETHVHTYSNAQAHMHTCRRTHILTHRWEFWSTCLLSEHGAGQGKSMQTEVPPLGALCPLREMGGSWSTWARGLLVPPERRGEQPLALGFPVSAGKAGAGAPWSWGPGPSAGRQSSPTPCLSLLPPPLTSCLLTRLSFPGADGGYLILLCQQRGKA